VVKSRDEIVDVATCRSWENLRPLPDSFVELRLDIPLNAEQSARLKQGFIPVMQEEKWFSYFEDGVLYQHRSWTGICIDEIHFVSEGETLRATHARVNRNPRDYTEIDDAVDLERINTMVLGLANLPFGATSKAVDPFVQMIEAASHPNYLGSPDVVGRIVADYVQVLVRNWRGGHDHEVAPAPPSQEAATVTLAGILSGNNSNYVTMPWHSQEQLGAHAMKHVGFSFDEGDETDLMETLICAITIFGEAVSDRLHQLERTASDQEISTKIRAIADFLVTVLLGTNAVHYPGKILWTNEGWLA